VRRDLDAFADTPAGLTPALQGQISASLTSLSRTIDEYDSVTRRELNTEKQSKGFERIKGFREEVTEYRAQFERLRKEREDTVRSVSAIYILTIGSKPL
jgi:Golgi SNAP receptor complex protein 2